MNSNVLDANTGLVNNYKPLMKDFPINDLLASTEISQLSNALKAIFEHLKKTKNAHYPIPRYLQLVEAISRDLCNKILEILHSKALMGLTFTEFEKITSDCRSLFTIWEDQFNKFREVIRELARKRRQDDVPLRINVDNKQLQERIMNVRNFRKQHEELYEVIKRVLPADEGGKQSLEEMQSAYENVKVVDPLVMSRDGTETWKRAMKVYDEKIDKVETHIKEQLRDRLAMAKNANEMFRVFSKFNALFYRPRVSGSLCNLVYLIGYPDSWCHPRVPNSVDRARQRGHQEVARALQEQIRQLSSKCHEQLA